MNYRLFTFLAIFLFVDNNICFAQSLEVASFVSAPNQYGGEFVKDLNNQPCALIKVQIVDKKVSFDGDVRKFEEKGQNEWWVWIWEGAKYLTIKSDSFLPYKVIFAEHDIKLVGHQTYILRLVQTPKDTAIIYQTASYPNILSYLVPGLGQIELGNKPEGYATIIGETLLLGGGIVSSISANNQLKVMRDVDVSLENYMSAKSKYNTLRAINVTCYVAAVALYGFHIYRVYHLSKQARRKEYASFTPIIMNTGESMSFGLCMNINF